MNLPRRTFARLRRSLILPDYGRRNLSRIRRPQHNSFRFRINCVPGCIPAQVS